MHEWLKTTVAGLASNVGDAPARYELTDGDIERLLDVARIAAHESGDRTNAPLLTYLVGLAHGRYPEQTLGTITAHLSGQPSV